MELAPEVPQQRAPLVGERRGEARGGIERVGDAEELLRLEATAACCAVDPGSDVVRPTDTDARSLAEQRSCLVGLVELSPDDDRVRRWLERLGHPLGRRERGRRRKPLANERELEQRLGSSVHVRPQRARGPETDG